MNRITLGVVLEALGQSPRPGLSAARKLGVRAVQTAAAGDLAPAALGETGRREFRTLLKSNDLTLAAMSCPLRFGLDAAENQQARLDHVMKAMQFAYDLGAKRLVVPMPAVPTDAADPRAATLRESLHALGGFGDRIGCVVCLECGLDAGDAVKTYLDTFDVGSLGVAYDPANFLMNRHDPLAAFASLSTRITYALARDARGGGVGGGAKEVPVGAGDIDWMSLLATAEAMDFRGVLAVDCDNLPDGPEAVAAGVRFLRRFIV